MVDERYEEALQLLDSTCDFPCEFMFKVIGKSNEEFVQQVVSTIRDALGLDESPSQRTRETPNGRHISVTVEPVVQTAEDVLRTYERLREIEGVVMVM